MPAWFALVVAAVAMLAGAIAAVAGTGVGSLVTPALSLRIDIRDAVLAVTAPHLVFNALRCWSVRTFTAVSKGPLCCVPTLLASGTKSASAPLWVKRDRCPS